MVKIFCWLVISLWSLFVLADTSNKTPLQASQRIILADGTYKVLRWHANGQLRSESYYQNENRHGAHKEWADNGALSVTGYYFDNKKQGHWRSWDKTGRLDKEGFFINDQKAFYWRQFTYFNGVNRLYEGVYIHNILTWARLHEDNKVSEVVFGADDSQRVTIYSRAGLKVSEQHFKHNKLEGLSKAWYANGALKEEAFYREGKLNGYYVEWSRGGVKLLEGIYKDNKKEGRWAERWVDGKWKSTIYYERGVAVAEKEPFSLDGV